MTGDVDYELIPKQELINLRREVEKIKKNPFGESVQGDSLLDSINELNSNIKRLIDLFASTESELAKDYAEHHPLEQLKTITEQNAQLSQDLSNVTNMVKQLSENSMKKEADQMSQQFMQSNISKNSSPQSTDLPPLPPDFVMPDFNQPIGLPPEEEKKKGFFSKK